jgi:Domain of unknown function (DUF4398)
MKNDQSRPCMRGMSLPALLMAVVAITVLTTAGCASTAPTASTNQIAVTTAALSHADSAGGAETAPEDMARARDKLTRANAALASRDFSLALSLAEEAQVDALLAESRARAAKAQRAATELREGRRVLREEMDRKNK